MEATKAENFGIPFLIYKIANLIYLFILILKATKKLFFWGSIIKINGCATEGHWLKLTLPMEGQNVTLL